VQNIKLPYYPIDYHVRRHCLSQLINKICQQLPRLGNRMVTYSFPAIVRFGYVIYQRKCGDVRDAILEPRTVSSVQAKLFRKRGRVFMTANSSDCHSTVYRGRSNKELHNAVQNTDHRAKLTYLLTYLLHGAESFLRS